MTTKRKVRTITMIKPTAIEEQGGFNSHIEGRVGRLEGAVENLTHEVQETSKAVREIATNIGGFKEDVLSHIGTATAPKWPLIVSFVMVALTVIGLGGTLVTQNMSGQGAAITKISTRLDVLDEHALTQARDDGMRTAWREMMDKKADKLDVDLQREMRLVNENTDSKVQALDKNNTAKLVEIQAQLAEIHKWRIDHEVTNAGSHGRIDAEIERLKALALRMEERQYDIGRLVAQLDYLHPNGGAGVGAATPVGSVIPFKQKSK